MLTAYDAPMAELMDPHVDMILVGDSLGMVVHGLPSTVGVTMEMMILHGQAVMRGSEEAFVVVDMPFGSYETSEDQAFLNAARIMKETGCQAVKIESGAYAAKQIAHLVERGIPVMGHVGLRPQAINVDGGFRAKGRTETEREIVINEARAADRAGAFAIVIEGVAEDLAAEITAEVSCPTIGIGASAACDGQVLVAQDMLGLFDWAPKFVRRYATCVPPRKAPSKPMPKTCGPVISPEKPKPTACENLEANSAGTLQPAAAASRFPPEFRTPTGAAP